MRYFAEGKRVILRQTSRTTVFSSLFPFYLLVPTPTRTRGTFCQNRIGLEPPWPRDSIRTNQKEKYKTANILRVADPLESASQSVQLYAMQKEERKTTQVEKDTNSSIDSLAGWGRDEKWASSDIDWDASASLPVKILVPASKLLPRKLQNPTAIRWYVFRITWGGGEVEPPAANERDLWHVSCRRNLRSTV